MPPLQLPPLRRSFLERMTVAHWFLLAYPVFLAIVARRRDADDVFTIDSSAVMQIGFVAVLGLFCGARLVGHGRALLRVVFFGPAGWMAAYALLAISSAAWSSRPDFTLYRAVEMTVFLLVTVEAVYRFADLKDVVRFQLLYALVVAVVWHFADLRYEMSWEILHNSLVTGTNIGALAIFAGAAISGRFWWTAFLLVGASFLVGTSSASYVSLLFGVGCLMMFHTGAQRVVGALLAATTGVVIWGTAWTGARSCSGARTSTPSRRPRGGSPSGSGCSSRSSPSGRSSGSDSASERTSSGWPWTGPG